MHIIYRASRPQGAVLRQCAASVCADPTRHEGTPSQIEYLTFPNLERTGVVSHLFTTRLGGCSSGDCASMNLSFSRGDDPGCVRENYRRIAGLLGCTIEDIVCSDQTHTTNIRRVTGEDRGKGVVRARDYSDVDGLVTNISGIALATFYADCVPLYFVDPIHHAVGLAHSGWRGTVAKMGERMVNRMGEEFGTRPRDMYAAIGPSICQKCYEVSADVAEAFQEAFRGVQDVLEEIRSASCGVSVSGKILIPGREPGKYQLDLWLANLVILMQSGIPLSAIAVTDICTCHNPDYLFSHRASQGRRGNLGAFLMLNNS